MTGVDQLPKMYLIVFLRYEPDQMSPRRHLTAVMKTFLPSLVIRFWTQEPREWRQRRRHIVNLSYSWSSLRGTNDRDDLTFTEGNKASPSDAKAVAGKSGERANAGAMVEIDKTDPTTTIKDLLGPTV